MKLPFRVLSLVLIPFTLHAADTTLAERLVSLRPEVREEATVEFRKMPLTVRERFAPSLMVAMSSENPYIREQAATLLKEIGANSRPATDPASTPAAATEATKTRDAERARAVKDFQQTKPTANRYQNLKDELQSEKSTQPDWMALKGQSGQSNLKATLLEGLGDTDSLIRSRSARRLSTLHPLPSEALPLLEGLLSDADSECRAAAAVALGGYGSGAQGMVVQLGTLLNDPDQKVRVSAQEALRVIQNAR